MVGAAGIEPALTAYKTGTLPLMSRAHRVRKLLAHRARKWTAPEAGTAGFEPAAFRLTAGRSAN